MSDYDRGFLLTVGVTLLIASVHLKITWDVLLTLAGVSCIILSQRRP